MTVLKCLQNSALLKSDHQSSTQQFFQGGNPWLYQSLKSAHSLHFSIVVSGTAHSSHIASPIIAIPHPTHISVIAKHSPLIWHIATRVVSEIGWVASKIARVGIETILLKQHIDNSEVMVKITWVKVLFGFMIIKVVRYPKGQIITHQERFKVHQRSSK